MYIVIGIPLIVVALIVYLIHSSAKNLASERSVYNIVQGTLGLAMSLGILTIVSILAYAFADTMFPRSLAKSTDPGILCGALLFVLLFLYVIWPEKNAAVQREKTRLDFLEELKEQIYANLRDLNFEFQAGKYPQEDYAAQRTILEGEAATVLAEMDALSGAGRA